MKRKADWADYEVRTGSDGKPGIYLRDFNLRLATFNANTAHIQIILAELFGRAHRRAQRAERLAAVAGKSVNALTAACSKPRRFKR